MSEYYKAASGFVIEDFSLPVSPTPTRSWIPSSTPSIHKSETQALEKLRKPLENTFNKNHNKLELQVINAFSSLIFTGKPGIG